MNYNYRLVATLFIEKKKIYRLLLFFTMCSFILNIISYCFFKTVTKIDTIIYMIIAFTLIKLQESMDGVKDEFYNYTLLILNVLVILTCFYDMLPINVYFKFNILNNICNTINFSLIISFICLQCLKLDVYRELKYKLTPKVNLAIPLLILINYELCINGYASLSQFILDLISIFVLLLSVYIITKSCKTKNKDNFNLPQIKIAILFMMCLIDCIGIVLYNKVFIVYLIRKILYMGFGLTLGYVLLEKYLNDPYKVLFNDIYENNIELNELNNQIKLKNIELEFSQMFIKKKEKMFKKFFLKVPIPLIIVNQKERIIFANESFRQLINNDDLKNIINKNIFSIVSVEKPIDILSKARQKDNIHSGTILVNNELRYVDMEFIGINDGKEVVIVFNDVTTKIKLDTLKAKVENNQVKEKIKNEFLSNISHDLKTPINVIYSASQLINMFIKSNNLESVKKYNSISRMNCISLTRLTNNLIDSSRIYSDYISADLHIKNIVEVVEEIVTSLVQYAKNKKIDLIFDTSEEEIYVSIDETFMDRIIMNLISNALKFTGENGKIKVMVNADDKYVTVSVCDNGRGMDKEFIEKAFSKYSMDDSNRNMNKKGTGIGLFVVKKLVEKQNGIIDINSKIDVGTNIKIRFKRENKND